MLAMGFLAKVPNNPCFGVEASRQKERLVSSIIADIASSESSLIIALFFSCQEDDRSPCCTAWKYVLKGVRAEIRYNNRMLLMLWSCAMQTPNASLSMFYFKHTRASSLLTDHHALPELRNAIRALPIASLSRTQS